MTEDQIAALCGGKKAAKRLKQKPDKSYAQMHAALTRIAAYQTPEELRESSEEEYGVDADEAIEMAYENVIEEAKIGLRGVAKP